MYVSTVWVMIHGRTVAATYQPRERQRHPESSSLILTLVDVQIHTRRKQFLTSTVIIVYVCIGIHSTWWNSSGDGGGCDHALPCCCECGHLDRVLGGGVQACQPVLQGGVGQGPLHKTRLNARYFPPQCVA